MTVMRSARSSTSERRCETYTTRDALRFEAGGRRRTAARFRAWKSRSSARRARERAPADEPPQAISTSCISAIDRRATFASGSSFGIPSRSERRARLRAHPLPGDERGDRRSPPAPTSSRFPRRSWSGRGRVPDRPRRCPRRGCPAATRNATGLPSIRISPSLGGNSPASTFISVDLPAPFSPTTACTSPRRKSHGHAVERDDAGEPFGYPAYLDDFIAGDPSWRSTRDGARVVQAFVAAYFLTTSAMLSFV